MSSPMSPLARLVLFMICLSVAGSAVAAAHYAAIDMPQQKNLTEYTRCTSGCISSDVVYMSPTGPRTPTDDACQKSCREKYFGS